MERRKREERLAAKGCTADDVRDDRGKDDGAEGIDREVLKDELERKEHPRNGRVECCRDPRGSPARDEQTQPALGDVQRLPDRGSQCRTNLHDWPLPSDRPAGSDTDR